MNSPFNPVFCRWAALVLVLTVALGSLGCGSSRSAKPPKTGPAYRYVIGLDDSLAGAEFQVDVLAVNSSTYARYGEGSVSDYFKPGSDQRPASSATLGRHVFSASLRELRLDLRKDPALRKYRFPGYSHVVVLADIPVAFAAGKSDPRRLLLPLDPNKWPRKWIGEKNLITVTISRDGLKADPGPSVAE